MTEKDFLEMSAALLQLDYGCRQTFPQAKQAHPLYAPGSDTCGIYGHTCLFPLPGSTMDYAMNRGRPAAEPTVDCAGALV